VPLEVLSDGRAHRHCPEGDVAGGQAFGDRHDVRHDVPVVDREPFARAAEPRHDLVGDEENPVAVAEGAHPLEVAVGRDQDAVGAGDRLEDERRDGCWALELDGLLQVGQRRLRVVERAERAVVRVEHVDHADQARLVRPSARVAGQADRPAGGAVVGAVARQDLLPPGHRPGDPDGVVVCRGAAQGEEDLADVTGEDLGQLLAQASAGLGGHERADVGEPLRLTLDRLDDAAVAVADVHAHELGVEVEVASAFRGPEVDALGVVDGDGVDCLLRLPVEHRVTPGERDDLLTAHRHGRSSEGKRAVPAASS
jgi:hypothetical protein